MTDDPSAKARRYWGHGVLQRQCAHIRRTSEGQPDVDYVDGQPVGLALCGCLLIADITPDAAGVIHCSVCLEISSAAS